MPNDPLSELRDLHLPDPVSFWPPALGWWIILLLVIGAAFAGYFLYRRYQRLAYQRQALKELQEAKQQFDQEQDPVRISRDLSILLRRVALHRYGREQAAGLIGSDWLRFLDEKGKTKQFSEGPGQVLTTLPFLNWEQQEVEVFVDANDLVDIVQDWIKQK